MGYLEAILLGIIQGLTEFLPVSSSGHLVAFQKWLKHDPGDPSNILFALAVHLGTVVAILFYYRNSVKNYVLDLRKSLSGLNQPVELYKKSVSIRFTILAMVATFGTGIVYVFLKDTIKEGFNSITTVAICWFVTATVLLITDKKGRTKGSLRNFTIVTALLIGLAQGLAMFPGISRSGSTICVAVLLGLRRRWAGEFSFLIGSIAISGASLLEGMDYFNHPQPQEAIQWGPFIVGAIVSAIVGFLALALLIWAVKKAKLKIFAIYCYLIAIVTLIVVYLPKSTG